jgi:hypothetical protein
MKLFIVQFSPISYYFQPLKSADWSELFPDPVHSLSWKSQNKRDTHSYKKNYVNIHVFILQ